MKVFSRYQIFIIALLSILQFTVVLDFMVLSPLGAQLIKVLHLTTSQFALAVSGYAFSAGLSGLLTAGFADKFDRKKLLLFFYTGFIVGTFLCGIAPNYYFPALSKDNYRFVRRSHKFSKLCHHLRSVRTESAGTCYGFRTDGFCNQPGNGHSCGTLFRQQGGMACTFPA